MQTSKLEDLQKRITEQINVLQQEQDDQLKPIHLENCNKLINEYERELQNNKQQDEQFKYGKFFIDNKKIYEQLQKEILKFFDTKEIIETIKLLNDLQNQLKYKFDQKQIKRGQSLCKQMEDTLSRNQIKDKKLIEQGTAKINQFNKCINQLSYEDEKEEIKNQNQNQLMEESEYENQDNDDDDGEQKQIFFDPKYDKMINIHESHIDIDQLTEEENQKLLELYQTALIAKEIQKEMAQQVYEDKEKIGEIVANNEKTNEKLDYANQELKIGYKEAQKTRKFKFISALLWIGGILGLAKAGKTGLIIGGGTGVIVGSALSNAISDKKAIEEQK